MNECSIVPMTATMLHTSNQWYAAQREATMMEQTKATLNRLCRSADKAQYKVMEKATHLSAERLEEIRALAELRAHRRMVAQGYVPPHMTKTDPKCPPDSVPVGEPAPAPKPPTKQFVPVSTPLPSTVTLIQPGDAGTFERTQERRVNAAMGESVTDHLNRDLFDRVAARRATRQAVPS